jgi:hypothetical protein
MKPRPVSRFSKSNPGGRKQSWHNGSDVEILQYARSLQNAAKTLAGKLELDRSAGTGYDGCPVVLLYRDALEIHLKLFVGEGSNFLSIPTDHLTLHKTRSLRWLAQIVCQIIKAVVWKSEFKCGGVSSLAEFSTVVDEVETFDPVARAVRSSRTGGIQSASEFYRTFNVVQFAAKLDALLDLLDGTSDALAAEWDQHEEVAAGTEISGDDDFKPTIR